MYQVFFDKYPLYDPRDPQLYIRNPDVHLAVGEAGEMSFTIDPGHPYASRLTRLKGIVELRTASRAIFKGRIRKDTRGFELSREIEVEGLLACLNDSQIPPFNFPADFEEDAGYQAAAQSGNVVAFLLGWFLDQHNSQVGPAQRILLGDVTVADPNNYITRSSSDFTTAMEAVKKRLVDLLGGYLLPDYSGETTVLHYYADLPLTNVQEVEFGENLLDLVEELDSADTYTAILPIGAEGLTLAELPDGEISPGVWKSGLIIYSKELEDELGGRITKKVAWDGVTLANNLQTKAATMLTSEGIKTAQTITVKAVDLGAVNDLPRFVVGRYVKLNSAPHGFSATYPLMELDPDILDPGNTKITMGRTAKTLLGFYADWDSNLDQKIESSRNELKDYVANVETGLRQEVEGLNGLYFYIKYSPYADGHVMTDTPQPDTQYMGTCSVKLKQDTAPTDYRAYTWCRVRGEDGENGTPGAPGADGRTQYLHIKYSDDGQTFTANNGEELGAWIGTLVDFTEADSLVFSDYTWKKFTEDVDQELEDIRRTIIAQYTELINTSEQIILTALVSYAETKDLEALQQTVSAQLQVLADEISMVFTETTDRVVEVDGDLQRTVETLSKHFDFSTDGLTIKAGEHSMSLKLDNGMISFQRDGQQFGWWDGVDFHTGNIVVDVNERAQFGNFAAIPRSNGSLSWLKVRG